MFRNLKTKMKKGYAQLKLGVGAGVALMRAESPEEQARAQKVIAGAVVGGVIILLAPYIPAAMGLNTAGLPAGIITVYNNLRIFLTGLGAIVLTLGIIYGAIQLKRRK